jgi:hypothetical protein
MSFANAYEIRVEGIFLAQTTINVVHVEVTGSEFDAADVMQVFIYAIKSEWLAVSCPDYSVYRVYVRNLANPEDFYDYAASGWVGTGGSGQPYAPFAATGIRFVRRRLDMRHGYKRFGGLAEDRVENALLSSFQMAAAENLADALVGDWVNGTEEHVCDFVIIKRIKYHPEGETSWAYRLPETAEEYVSYRPVAYVVNPAVTSQNSRKFGHGS